MELRELRIGLTDPGNRGRTYGQAMAEEVRANITRYREAYPALGIDTDVIGQVTANCWSAVQSWAPQLAEELDGLAAGAQVGIDDLMLLNARTEILAHRDETTTECSAIAQLRPDRAPLSIQSWDWFGPLAQSGLLLEIELPDRTVRTFTEVGMLAKIGTAAGIGLQFNILRHVRDGAVEPGVPVHLVARRILDQASSIDDAISIANSAPLIASTVLTMTQAAPARAACLELSPVGVGVVESSDAVLVHTNHFLDPTLAEGEAVPADSSTWIRLDHLQRQHDQINDAPASAVALAAAACGSAGAAAPICVRPTGGGALIDTAQTLLTIAVDAESNSLSWYAGTPDRFTADSYRTFA